MAFKKQNPVSATVLVLSLVTLIGISQSDLRLTGNRLHAAEPGNDTATPSPSLPQKPIPLVTPGTLVRDSDESAAWNRLVMIAVPTMSSGDLEGLGTTVRDAASLCSLTLMAEVRRVPQSGGFKILRFGVGNAMAGSKGSVIVSADSAEASGVTLNFLTRQVLAKNQERLGDVMLVAKTDTLVVFDAPSLMLRRDEHRNYITRHLAYIDAKTGQGATMIWLLAPPAKGAESMSVIDNPIRIAKWGLRESRKIHVDGSQFNFMGIPSDEAFALEDLPPGMDVNWTQRAAKTAGRRRFTVSQLQELSDAMREALTIQLKGP